MTSNPLPVAVPERTPGHRLRRSLGRALFAISAAVLFACGDEVLTEPPQLDDSERQVPYSGESEFERLAAGEPAFAGFFYEGSTLVVLVNREEARSTVLPFVQNSLSAAAAFDPQSTPEQLVVRQVEFSFSQLRDWRNAASEALDRMSGITFLDLDEVNNRVTVGVVEEGYAPQVRDVLGEQGVPGRALDVVVTGPFRLDVSAPTGVELGERGGNALQDLTLRDFNRPVRGGLKIRMKKSGGEAMGACTLGFNASRAGVDVFIVNSHCTAEDARTDGTLFYQVERHEPEHYIGVELDDPRADDDCGWWILADPCRYSDAALAGYATGVDFAIGTIARTTSRSTTAESGSITIDSDNPYLNVYWATRYPSAGQDVDKIGQRTGWTGGEVSRTCTTVNWVGGMKLKCQYHATYYSDQGDSGSPVFKWNGDGGATLTGIHWGRSDGLRVFSPLGGIENDIGSLEVLSEDPPPPPPLQSVTIIGPRVVDPGETETWTAEVSGGREPYSYVWSGVLSGTESSVTGALWNSGTLYVTVTDDRGDEVSAHAVICVRITGGPPIPCPQ